MSSSPSDSRDRLTAGPARPALPESIVLVALVCGALSVLAWGTTLGAGLIGMTFALGCLGGVGVALREHRAGRRSRAGLLAAAAASAVSAVLLMLRVPIGLAGLGAAATLLAAFLALSRDYAHRSTRHTPSSARR